MMDSYLRLGRSDGSNRIHQYVGEGFEPGCECTPALAVLKVELWLSTWDPEPKACGFHISD
jgi:hypothetical protein